MTHDPGGKSFRPLPPGVTGSGLFSGPNTCYRLELRRKWQPARPDDPFLMFIGLNPSTADGDFNDPTVDIECGITERLGFYRYLKMNVSPYRSTDPAMLKHAAVPLCPASHVERLFVRAMTAGQVVMACGVPPGPLLTETDKLFDILLWGGVELWCLGTTRGGYPRHPLYMPTAAPLARWYGLSETLGPTHRFYTPDQDTPPQDGDNWHVGDAFAVRAFRPRRLSDLTYYQVVGLDDDGTPVTVPAAHLANRYSVEIEAWAKRVT